MTELRPYQSENVTALDALVPGDRVLSVGPTGSGKTVIFCELIKRKVAKFKRVLVIAHRREIITQTSRKLYDNGVRHGIIQAGFDPRPMEPVQVASIATLYVRAIRSEAMRLPIADLVIVDEAHHSVAHTYSEIIKRYPEAIIIGFTATPCRGDGHGLGGIFNTLIEMPQVAALIDQKHLVPTLCYAPVDPDLSGVRVQAGDYAVGQLERRMNTDKLVGDIVTHWHKYGQNRPTVVFAVGVAHSIHLRDEFLKSGVTAEHLDGSTPKDERDAILKRLASGETTIVSNCQVLTEGWDCPETACTILARPTKSMGLFRQMIGRVLRPAPGKVNAIVLDHSGAVYRHGLPEDHVDWSLSPDHKAVAPAHEARKQRDKKVLLDCPACDTLSIRLGGQPCPNCGWLPKRAGEFVATAAGELGLVTGGRARGTNYDPATRALWHAMFVHINNERGYSPRWHSVQYKEKFGEWPKPFGHRPDPITPTPEVRSWVRSRQIAYAKSRGAA
jgi:DNA repair protein RadD